MKEIKSIEEKLLGYNEKGRVRRKNAGRITEKGCVVWTRIRHLT